MSALIWSIEHKAWWRADSQGYTNNLASAGLYEYDEAQEIVKASNGKNEKTVSLEVAFRKLQTQAYQADKALTKLSGLKVDIDCIIKDTRLLERT